MNTEKELELLKAENVQLKRDQEFLFLVLDISLGVVEQWAKDNGLLAAASENSNQDFANRDNQVRVFIEQIRKLDQDALINRMVGLLDARNTSCCFGNCRLTGRMPTQMSRWRRAKRNIPERSGRSMHTGSGAAPGTVW